MSEFIGTVITSFAVGMGTTWVLLKAMIWFVARGWTRRPAAKHPLKWDGIITVDGGVSGVTINGRYIAPGECAKFKAIAEMKAWGDNV